MVTDPLDLLFPRRCPVCGDVVQPLGGLICPGCAKKLDPSGEPLCKKCGTELFSDQAEYCFACTRHPRSFNAGRGMFKYNAAAARSLAAIKYRNRREYLDFYAQVMAGRYHEQVLRWKPDCLVPVPVHPSRRRARGFNQAEELARRLGRFWDLPVDAGLLIRVKRTAPQKELGAAERLKNLREAFAAAPGKRMPDCVLLIDDIYTTGSTMEACTGVLRAAGAKNVYFLTIGIGYGR